MEQKLLGTENIYILLAKFTIPAVIAMVIAGSQTIVDGMLVGNYVGQNALASINIAMPFMQIIFGISFVLSMGALSFIGRSLGEGKTQQAQNIFRTALILNLVTTGILAVISLLFSRQIAGLLGASPLLIDDVAVYIKIMGCFSPFVTIMFLFGFTDRLLGKPNLYLYGTILSIIVNISLDIIVLKYLKMGVKGAALATGFAYTVSFFIVIWPLLKKKNILNIYSGHFDKSVIVPMVYNGSSEAVSSAAAAITVFLFNNILMSIAGEAGVAAYTTIGYVTQFASFLMFGISDGVGPIISYNYGHGSFDRVKKLLKISVIINSIIGVLLFVVLMIFSDQLVSLFVDKGSEAIKIASSGARIYAIASLMNGFNIISSGYFTAIGHARNSIIVAISRGLIFILIGLAILPSLFGITGVWLAVPFAETITMLMGIVLLKKQNQVDQIKFSKRQKKKSLKTNKPAYN